MSSTIKSWLLVITVPVVVALLFRWLFDVAFPVTLMSISFLGLVPYVLGYLTVLLSDRKKIENRKYCIFSPWIVVAFFLLLTVIANIEGAACWIMILPVWLIFASIGGGVAGWQLRKKREDSNSQKLQSSWIILLPILCSPVERLLPLLPARYEAYTYIDIQAPAEKIWSNVVRVRTIAPGEDHGGLTKWMSFPRPIRAELDVAGVGGRRQAIFSKGLVFEEIVNDYADQQRMQFSIKADPHAIPPTTMDKHIIIGGEYFDVLDGTYRLEKLSGKVYRLHLYSHFVLRTSFNFYASWWAGWIMKDIQNNILQVIQTRCQANL